MADRGRDLKFSILSDVSKLETDAAARGLDSVGDAALDAGRRLDDLDRDVASVDLERLGKDAKDTARDVDNAFDTIARASRRSTTSLDDDTRKAGQGLDDLKDEAGSTGREAAASFSGGFDDITDAIQETAANAFAGFGPAGAAAGLVAAAGIGIATTKIREARERVRELASELIEAGGKVNTDSIFSRIADAATDGNLDKLARSARALGIDVTDLQAIFADASSARAFVETLRDLDPALERVNNAGARFKDVTETMGQGQERAARFTGEQRAALRDLESATRDSVAQFEQAEKVARLYEEVTGHSIDTLEAYSDAIAGIADGSDVMSAAIEDSATRQAKATKDTEDSWQDYADTALASIDDVIDKQLEQLTAAEDFNDNMARVFDRLGQDAVDWALSQGDNADKAMQLLASAPLAKGRQVAENFRRTGELAGAGYASGIDSQERRIDGAAAGVHASAAGILGRRISVPVDLNSDGIISEAERVRADIQSRMRSIVIPILAGPFAGTAANARYRP